MDGLMHIRIAGAGHLSSILLVAQIYTQCTLMYKRLPNLEISIGRDASVLVSFDILSLPQFESSGVPCPIVVHEIAYTCIKFFIHAR
jgi:hypothetical protein